MKQLNSPPSRNLRQRDPASAPFFEKQNFGFSFAPSSITWDSNGNMQLTGLSSFFTIFSYISSFFLKLASFHLTKIYRAGAGRVSYELLNALYPVVTDCQRLSVCSVINESKEKRGWEKREEREE